MATEKITEYERRRLENIKRNDEMVASLRIHSTVNQLSAATKRQRVQTKSYKISPEKKTKAETPIVIRRSLRTRGMPPDSSTAAGLKDDFDETLKTPKKLLSAPRISPRELGPIRMRDAYTGANSDKKLIEKFLGVSKKSQLSCYDGVKGENDAKNMDIGCLEINKIKSQVSCFAGVKEEIDSKNVNIGCLEINKIKSQVSCFAGVKEEIDSKNVNIGCYEINKIKSRVSCFAAVKEEIDSKNVNIGCLEMKKKILRSVDVERLALEPENIARVVPGRIMSVKFFPSADMTTIIVGNKLGDVGFWNADTEKEDGDGIYVYHPHSGPVSGIAFQPFSLSKMFTSCYDGFIRLMDVEREVFDLVYSSDNAIFSISQRPDDTNSLYFGEGPGKLNIWDVKAGRSSFSLNLHEDRINTLDFNSENSNIMATSSTDGTACIWDLRNIDADKPISLKTVTHRRAVHSAYFSPSGNCLATTSFDDTVGLHDGANYEDISMIYHYNQTGRWISSFRAIWGWDDSYIFIGNMRRGADVISSAGRRIVKTLKSEHISAIPCRFDAHPYKVGMLAGSTSGGQVYIWTSD